MALDVSGADELRQGSRYTSDYVLLDLFKGIRINGSWMTGYGGHAIPVSCIYFARLRATAVYLSTKTSIHDRLPSVRARISRIQYGPSLFPYGTLPQSSIVRAALRLNEQLADTVSIARLPLTIEVLTNRRHLPVVRAHMSHLRHVLPSEIGQAWSIDELASAIPSTLRFVERCISRNIMHESWFCGLVIWAYTMPRGLRALVQRSEMWSHQPVDSLDYAKFIKENYSLKFKALQNNVGIDLSPLFECEVLVNRGVSTIDWSKERYNRQHPNLAQFSPDEIYTQAYKIFMQARSAGGKPSRSTWKHYWAERWMWATVGSFHSQYKKDDKYIASNRDLKNKFYSINRMPDVPAEYFLTRKRETQAWASVKNEWGKDRAIYGVDITNFIVSGFAMRGCEEAMGVLYPIGKEAEDEHVAKHVDQVLRNGAPLCFDFEDFNSQHSFASMQAVLHAYQDIFRDHISHEQYEAITWTVEAFSNATIHDANGTYAAKATLMSGSRLTTFMNTILNDVYVRLIWSNRTTTSIHNGDDVLAAVTSYGQVQSLMNGARTRNVRFQIQKCFLSSIAEFLRVDHSSRSGAQYLARAVATYVHGPMDMTAPYDTLQQYKAMLTRRDEMLRRGADEDVLLRLHKVVRDSIERRRGCVGSLGAVERTHKSQGGTCEKASYASLCQSIASVRLNTSLSDEAEVVLEEMTKPLPGVEAYLQLLVAKYDLEQHASEIRGNLRNAIFSRALRKENTVKVTRRIVDSYEVFSAQKYKLYRNVKLGLKANIAKAFGIPILLAGHDAKLYSTLLYGSADPLNALRVWF